MADAVNIKKLEADLWESADLLRADSKVSSIQYCMPVLGLIFLKYAYSRYKMVEAEIIKNRPSRNGRIMPIEASDFAEKAALYLPEMAQYEWLVNLPNDIVKLELKNIQGQQMNSLGEVVNNAMELIELQSEQLTGVLPKDYTMFSDELLSELIRIFNNDALERVGGDVIGRIYEYFLNKFAKSIAFDDGIFFTPKSLVKMIVNILEPKKGVLLDPACGSGGMFVQTGDVDVIISVGNNFFYTKSLPCSLWFFDKGKPDELKEKVLFIDARNYYTVVDRTLNEWSECQLKNLNAIVWLYRGETDKYKNLISEYRHELNCSSTFEECLSQLKEEVKDLQKRSKAEIANAGRNDKKRIQFQFDEMIAEKNDEIKRAKEAVWLYEKFGNGEYQDIPGLCKIEDKKVILEEKGCSLTPGAYVGIAPVEDDGVDFEERMSDIHKELLALQSESNELMNTISKNLEEMGL